MSKTILIVHADRSLSEVPCTRGWEPKHSETLYMSESCYDAFASAQDFLAAPIITPGDLSIDDVPWFGIDGEFEGQVEVSQVFAGIGVIDFKIVNGTAVAEISAIGGKGQQDRHDWLVIAVRLQMFDKATAN